MFGHTTMTSMLKMQTEAPRHWSFPMVSGHWLTFNKTKWRAKDHTGNLRQEYDWKSMFSLPNLVLELHLCTPLNTNSREDESPPGEASLPPTAEQKFSRWSQNLLPVNLEINPKTLWTETHRKAASGTESKFFSSGCCITVGIGRKTNGLMPINKGYC